MIYSVEKIKKSYGQGDNRVEVLNEVSISINAGERVAILGPSGCGKSTLLNILGTIDRCDSGKILWRGEDISGWSNSKLTELRKRRFGFIFQSYHLISALTVADNIIVPLLARGEKADYEKVEQICEEIGLKERINHYPHQLSGGEKQRVAIARAVIGEPDIIFADEATGNLDEKNSIKIMELLSGMVKKKNITLVYVTHDLSLLSYADRVLRLEEGKLVENTVRRSYL